MWETNSLQSSSNSQLYTLEMENTQSLILLRQSRSSERHRLGKRAEGKRLENSPLNLLAVQLLAETRTPEATCKFSSKIRIYI